ncbi:MAG: 3'-5' exonuclease [Candidatus Babeliales bacterium]|nr:3'-5' exonuclease [Candidatus Babeliales bacterium]
MSDKIQTFNDFLVNNLNPNQLKAVKQRDGTLLVIAGAGSGKTRVITARIANLMLNEGAQASSIIALTFTNKAAKEMKTRITSWLENANEIPFVGTFHSFCLRLLKNHSHLLEIPKFSILDDDDQKKILADIIKRNNLNKKITPDQLSFQISTLKNNLALGNAAFSFENKMLQELYLAYEIQRKANRSFDFDDLIIETLKLFMNNKSFKDSFQSAIKHVLVDEYQDTSAIQHALLKQIAQTSTKEFAVESLCIVGDEDQSVYSWRGANVDNIVFFHKDFPKAITIKIEQNYRSVKPILDIANKVISHNKNRNPKNLWSDKQAKNRVVIASCTSEYQEGEMIANLFNTVMQQKKYNSMAVLYRAHYQSRAIEEALLKHSIPYKIIGGIQFYERKEIKDLLAYLRLMVNPYDRVSFFRVVNCPPRRLGDKFEEEFYNLWEKQPLLNFKEVAQKLIDEQTLVKTKEESLLSFIKLFEGFDFATQATSKVINLDLTNDEDEESGNAGPSPFDMTEDNTAALSIAKEDKKTDKATPCNALNHIIQKTQYLSYLQASFEPNEAESKIENVRELIRAASHFEERAINSVSEFLEQIALLKEKMQESKETDNDVKLMTLHGAKGLEFDVVTIAGLEEGIIPSNRSLEREEALEEERRLFYVGITRAKEFLVLSKTLYRKTYGQTLYQASSRFLDEVPENLVQRQDCNYWTNLQFEHYFANWLGYIKPENVVLTFGSSRSYNEAPKPTFKSTEKVTPSTFSSRPKLEPAWRPNRTVKHKEFGLGIIQEVNDRGNGKLIITTKFGTGIKKIDSTFLEII